MLKLSRRRALEWARTYDQRYRERDMLDERSIKAWIRGQPDQKHLSKGQFLRLARWLRPRGSDAIEENSGSLVREATSLAYRANDDRLKVHILTALAGVDVTMAAAILHFLYTRRYPIFDIRVRRTLKKAGLWKRRANDASVEAWEEYVAVMRRLARRLRMSLRDLDKALYAYDRWR